MNAPFRTSAFRTALSVVLFFSFASAFCIAQTEPIWRLLETGLTSEPTFDRFRFQDSLHGYAYRVGFPAPYGQITAVTDDGGRTWRPGDLGPALAFNYGDVVVGPDGQISYDGGKSFSYMNPTGADTLMTVSGVYTGRAASPRHFAAMFVGGQLFEQPFGTLGSIRMAWTTDGGTTWNTADSAAYDEAESLYKLVPRAGYGPFPGSELTRWNFFVGYLDTTHLLAVRSTDTSGTPEYYLGVIDLAARKASWTTLPFWKGIATDFADAIPLIRILSPQFIVVGNYSASDGKYLWKSSDTGRTWEPMTVPVSNISVDDISLLSDSTWRVGNSLSRDSGKTWIRRNPFWLFGSTSTFYPVTENRFLVGEGPFVALSEDGGETWTRNAPALPITAMIARDGLLAETRGRHMLRLSNDDGGSWNDLGDVSGELPANLNTIRTLAWYDAATAPDRFFGAGVFAPENDSPYVAVIETRNGGLSWNELGRVPESRAVIPSQPRMQWVPKADGEGKVGFLQFSTDLYKSIDEGMTWQKIWTWERMLNPRFFMLDELRGIHTVWDGTAYLLMTTTNGGERWDTLNFPGPGIFTRLSPISTLPGSAEVRIAALAGDSTPYLLSSPKGITGWQARRIAEAPVGEGEWVWLDADRVFVRSGEFLYYSGNGGSSFDTVQRLPYSPDTRFGPFATLVGHDSRYLYFDVNPLGLGRRLITPESTTGVTFHREGTTELTLDEISAFDGSIRFRYSAGNAAPLYAQLFDMQGRKVAEKMIEGERGSMQSEELQIGDIPSGNYLMRISGKNGEWAAGLIGIGR